MTLASRAQSAINRDQQANADRAADKFRLTEAQYTNLAAMSEADCAYYLRGLVNSFDFNRRDIAGVTGSLTVRGIDRWQSEWLADEVGHMMRARNAFEVAAQRFVGDAA